MGKLVVGLVLLLGLAAAAALVPLRGRMVLDRWSASRGPRDVVERSYHEAKAAAGLEPERPARARPARPPKPQARPATPTEGHSEADRAALERIIAEHAGH
jgi:hypothetical protein